MSISLQQIVKAPPGTRTHPRAFEGGRISLLLAFSPFFDAVVDGFAAFLFGATLFVALPAGFLRSHQSAKAADSTGVTGR